MRQDDSRTAEEWALLGAICRENASLTEELRECNARHERLRQRLDERTRERDYLREELRVRGSA